MIFSKLIQELGLEVKDRKSGWKFSDCPLCRSNQKLSFHDEENFFFCWGCRNRGNIKQFRKILFGESE